MGKVSKEVYCLGSIFSALRSTFLTPKEVYRSLNLNNQSLTKLPSQLQVCFLNPQMSHHKTKSAILNTNQPSQPHKLALLSPCQPSQNFKPKLGGSVKCTFRASKLSVGFQVLQTYTNNFYKKNFSGSCKKDPPKCNLLFAVYIVNREKKNSQF